MHMKPSTTRLLLAPFAALLTAALLSSCAADPQTGAAADEATGESDTAAVHEPIAVTYDGGIYLLDGETLEVQRTVPLEGFNRVNGAGDAEHVFVSTADGFDVLNAVTGEFTGTTFPGEKPGHVVLHEGKTILFHDGTGTVTSFDSDAIAAGQPKAQTYQSAEAHHGVAVELADGTLVTTLGNAEERPGAIALDGTRKEFARSESCPGVHGEAVAEGETVAFGCKDGVLLFKDGEFVKIQGAAEYAAVSTQAGSEESPIILGDYKVDPDAEREFPTQFALVDTEHEKLDVVQMPDGASYSFRSFGRGAHGEAYILGTDGKIHVVDTAAGKVTESWPVVSSWQEPMDWQAARPALFARGHDLYVTEPQTKKVLRIDGATGKVLAETALDAEPNELSGVAVPHVHAH